MRPSANPAIASLAAVGKPFEQGSPDQRVALPTDVLGPRHRRPGRQDQVVSVTRQHVAGGRDVHHPWIGVVKALERFGIRDVDGVQRGVHHATTPPSTSSV